MGLFNRKKEIRAQTVSKSDTDTIGVDLIKALLDDSRITREMALQIPAVSASIGKIARIVSSLPVKLYREHDGNTEEIREDRRLRLLNSDTGDALTSTQFWRAIVEDYYLGKGAFVYINKYLTEFNSLHYVDNKYISFLTDETDHIFKRYSVMVDGKTYEPYEFIKFLRNTKDGHRSRSIQEENELPLKTAYMSMKYEHTLVSKGGNKKGFLKVAHNVTEPVMLALKESFRKLYGNNEENVVVLNEGMDFQESSLSSVEMQLNESKETNFRDIASLIGVAETVIKGNSKKEDNDLFISTLIMPLLNDFEASLDRDFLTEEEKDEGYFWAFDAKELKRGDMKERFESYEIALKSGWLQTDEVREMEDRAPLGFEFIKLGLDCVLYNPKTKEIYTPNTNETVKIEDRRITKKEVNEDEN